MNHTEDHFKQKANDWDFNPLVRDLSMGISQSIREHAGINEQLNVMDFGAGTGLLCSQLVGDVKQITAVDISASMLEKLAMKIELKGKDNNFDINFQLISGYFNELNDPNSEKFKYLQYQFQPSFESFISGVFNSKNYGQ